MEASLAKAPLGKPHIVPEVAMGMTNMRLKDGFFIEK
jgi:hypothetical protein